MSNFPRELTVRPQWISWRLEVRNNKPTKTPINPKTGGYARTNDLTTWASFSEAVAYYHAHKRNGISGCGFVFSENDPFCGVDLDGCRDPETGEVEPWAREVIARLNSYTEISPSGRGVHIIIRAKLPKGGNRKGKIEIYDRARFFCMTGHHLPGTPTTIEDRQTELEALHRQIFGAQKAPAQAPQQAPAEPLPLSDRELIDKALQADDGCGPDPGRIDRLFRQSGLMRPKWDERHYGDGRTYGEATVEKAIAETVEFYRLPAGEKGQKKAGEATISGILSEIADLGPDAPLAEKLKRLSALVPRLARLSHLEA
ncbi:MAG: hypothetical protein JRI66_13310, partial [Deltaproteobacteria bacterium]|nr:hypothetical protein [Deltaproteobacteria bacterium]